ncbi:MAG: hypothetical protein L5656_04775 [Thermanaeromonas sp.]|nr:hypothetical protein [Thermanaeromonas sp.]
MELFSFWMWMFLRKLNYRLGKRWMAVEEVKSMVLAAELSDCCQICTEGGLWLIVRKR